MRIALSALLACAAFSDLPAAAQSQAGAFRPGIAKVEAAAVLRAPAASALATRVRLDAPPAESIAAMKAANARAIRLKRLDIGIGRDVPDGVESASAALRWVVAPGGLAAHWEVASAQARALRVALRFDALPSGIELRFAGSGQPEVVYGPFTAREIKAAGAAYWSPVLEGDTATVELYLPLGSSPQDLAATVAQVSHLFVSPADPKAESLAKAAGPCEVNFVCRAATDPALAQVGTSVARMSFISATGGSSLCTGTLLNPGDGSFTPYFYSAAHCFATQSSASTLTAHWHYESSACAANALSAAYTQTTGGAVLLYANETTDVLLVRLNSQPPASVFYAGWDAAAVSLGAAATAIHHPDGDLKKISLGAIAGFDSSPIVGGNFIRVQWNGLATGVTEPGSSGSAIFTGTGSGLRVRGGLLGGDSSCSATSTAELFDVYSRFDLAFPLIAQYLSPAAAPTLAGNALANPGFEGAAASWTQASTSGNALITNDSSTARSGAWYAWLGGVDGATDTLYQSLAIPAGAARLQFYYRVATLENTTSQPFDVLTLSINDAASGAMLQELGTLSNLDRTSGWVQSPVYDVSLFGNRTVRLQLRSASDASLATSFRIDDLTLNGTLATAGGNHTALWYKASESGWGINVSHQGDIAFATLFTYSSTGTPMWLVMPAGARQGGASTFMGRLFRTTGPAFNANPFTPLDPANITEVGSMTLDFTGATPVLGYSVGGAYVSKAIEKQVFGAAAANCQGTTGSRATASNYQDLWWNPTESGWGLNLTHQGDTIFGTLFTYAANGQGLWLVLPAGVRQPDGSFLGALYRTTGPAFNAIPFTPIGAGNITEVGTMRVRFSSGDAGTLEYSVDGASVTKAIQRQVFSVPVPACTG
jgi:hypothetical protein